MSGEANGRGNGARLPADRVRTAMQELVEVMAREGIDPDGSLGVVIGALGRSMDRVVGAVDDFQKGPFAALKEARRLSEAELEKLRAGNIAAEIALNQARTAQTVLEVQREALVSKMVKEAVPKMVAAVGEAVVIRERRLNRNLEMRRHAAYAAVAIVLLLSGYIGRWYQDDAAVNAVQRCSRTLVVDPATGKQYCPLDAVVGR
jgi:hypothetical protein